MDLQLQNKVSPVTGSTAGIGFAIAEALASEGASVIINGRSQPSVDEAIGKLSQKATGKLIGFAGDLARGNVAKSSAVSIRMSISWSTVRASSSRRPVGSRTGAVIL
jgi:NAD(P)-dependent dehydrogenase (short-subunit alcohol dehydrogenase family)